MGYLNLDEKAINIFTDGSSLPKPRRGGIGACIVWVDQDGKEVTYNYSPVGYSGATNQEMEIKACINTLRFVFSDGTPVEPRKFEKVVIYTDSMYLVNNFDKAKFVWSRNKWRLYSGAPVANAILWKELVSLLIKVRFRVEMKWVKAHKSSVYNKMADKLAKNSAKQKSDQKTSHIRVRRKKSSQITELGSVKMLGQKITIRIVTDQYLPISRSYKYKYEVMSKSSAYYKKVDMIFSEIMLSAGHVYYVMFNLDGKYPQILKKYREIESKKKG